MRGKLFALLLIAVMLCPASAFAAKRSFDTFSVDVPDGWKTEEQNGMVGFTAPDESAELVVGVGDAQGQSVKDIAATFSEAMGGGAPKADEGGYSFTAKDGDKTAEVFITVEDGKYILISVYGQHPDLEKLIDSIEGK